MEEHGYQNKRLNFCRLFISFFDVIFVIEKIIKKVQKKLIRTYY